MKLETWREKVWIGTILLGATLPLLSSADAHADRSAQALALKPNSKLSVGGKLTRGRKLDLAWANQSSVACFPSVKNDHFAGKHVLYTVDLPAKSVLKIKAKPKDAQTDVSLYAFSVGPTNQALPPDVTSVVSCEASYGSTSISKPFNPGAEEAVELNAVTNPYRVVIGVAGAKDSKEGDFQLELDLETALPPPTGTLTSATPIAAAVGSTVQASGSIDGGAQIDLAWAAKSAVACFPAPKNVHFSGNHVAYKFSLPRQTKATVELIPQRPDLDLSLYAYTMGPTKNDLPPNLNSVVSCEASYGTSSISQPYNPGGAESVELGAINNPYNAVIGVAGAQGVKQGDFTLKVTLAPR